MYLERLSFDRFFVGGGAVGNGAFRSPSPGSASGLAPEAGGPRSTEVPAKRKTTRGGAATIVVAVEICKGTGCPANLLCSFTSLIFLTTPLRIDKLSVR